MIFYFGKFTSAELNYNIYDKELLAIVDTFKTWKVYCSGSKHTINVITNYKNLMTFTITKVLNRRQVK